MNTLSNDAAQDFQNSGSLFIIYMIWAFWFLNQFLILIVLLNFLIAVISQSYENVMNSAQQFKYKQRCELIREAAIINETFGKFKDLDVFVL